MIAPPTPQFSTAKDKLKHAWNENPIGVTLVATAALTALGKVIAAVGGIQSRRAYARQIQYKIKK